MATAQNLRSRPVQVVALVISMLICFSAGGLGGLATTQGLEGWYETLSKPTWNPPSWVFGPVWSALYCMMGIAAWLVWRSGEWQQIKQAISLFVAQLALNSVWSVLFFGFQQPGWACVEIVFLWLAILATTIAFFRRSKVAAMLLTPYLFWVSFASILNFTIWSLNRA